MDTVSQRLHLPVDGGAMPVFACHPQGEGPFPAVIVVHEIFGVTPYIEGVAGRLATEGYLALAPDLFWNLPPLPDFTDRASFMRFRASLDDRRILSSLDACLQDLKDTPAADSAHVGIVGFCMGGYYAFLEAARQPSLAACVDFYGAPLRGMGASEQHPIAPLEAAPTFRVPFLGLFGAEDQSIPVEQVEELRSALRKAEVPCEIEIYSGAGHAFHNDAMPTYRQDAAESGWAKALAFFERHLKG